MINLDIKNLLIKAARNDKPITYGTVMNKLGLKTNNPNDRAELSKLLATISEQEHKEGRPLISSMVMYSDLEGHGGGFYELAENLGFGKRKKLITDLFGYTEMRRCHDFWKQDENYYKLTTNIVREHRIDFFKLEELHFFNQWTEKVYDKDNPEHVAAKNYLMQTVWNKVGYWANELSNSLEGYEVFFQRKWSQRGWDNGDPVSKFKHYAWARIYKKGDAGKDIFFTVEYSSESQALVYKLDYFFEKGGNLSEPQKALCKAHIPQEIKWIEISEDKISNLNWEKLLLISEEFIRKNEKYYDLVVKMAWEGYTPNFSPLNTLIQKNNPQTGVKYNSDKLPSFKGVEIDYIGEQIERKEIGNSGEELVLDFERKILEEAGLNDLAKQIKKVKDGEGYDIHSYFKDGSPKFIEVKTTMGDEKTPFDISSNEVSFSDLNLGKYFIYRLYNYNSERNTADFFIIENLKEERKLIPTSFKVYYQD